MTTISTSELTSSFGPSDNRETVLMQFKSDLMQSSRVLKRREPGKCRSTASIERALISLRSINDLNCAFFPNAKAAESDLQDGTCTEKRYTHQTGTQTKSYPIIGDLTKDHVSKTVGRATEGKWSMITWP